MVARSRGGPGGRGPAGVAGVLAGAGTPPEAKVGRGGAPGELPGRRSLVRPEKLGLF